VTEHRHKELSNISPFVHNNGILSINDALDDFSTFQFEEQKNMVAAKQAKGESAEKSRVWKIS